MDFPWPAEVVPEVASDRKWDTTGVPNWDSRTRVFQPLLVAGLGQIPMAVICHSRGGCEPTNRTKVKKERSPDRIRRGMALWNFV